MLSEKKSNIGNESIDFLGMVIQDGHYQPGPHIAIELLKFPDSHLTKKQIQQFLGIVNYVRDFILKVAVHTSHLSRMLKKQYPPWGPAQTEVVKQLKVIAQSPPPLWIPTTGQRILQKPVMIIEVAVHTSHLSRMLKKQYPPWGPAQIEVVKQLKVIASHLLHSEFLQPDNASSR